MLLSVIIPVYNVEKYLRRCLDSLVNQLDNDIEVICVNDGSLDNSYNICKEYALKFQNFFVYSKENGGVASARNLGLTKARGEYIAWVDSDDYLSSDWENTIKRILIKEQPDCLLFDYYTDHYGKIEEVHNGYPHEISKEQLIFELSLDLRLKSILMFKVVKKSLYENLKFDERAVVLEDYKLLTNLSLRLNKIITSSKCLYYYVRRADSLTNDSNIIKSIKSAEISKERYDLYEKEGFKVSKAGLWKMAILACLAKTGTVVLTDNQKNVLKNCQSILRMDLRDIILDSNVEIKVKFAVLLNEIIPKYMSSYIWDFIRNTRYRKEQ